MRSTVQDVLEGNGQYVWLLGASKIGDVGVEWHTLECFQSSISGFSFGFGPFQQLQPWR